MGLIHIVGMLLLVVLKLKTQPIAVVVWKQAIALYRDQNNQVHAIEDRCLHRQVSLSLGNVIDNQLECPYHGWRFNPEGSCCYIPYLSEKQKLPTAKLQTYPVCEQDGFIWLFLAGESVRESNVIPLKLPEWDDLNHIATVSTIDCQAHFSFLIENLMDMYHGHLHQTYQPWASAKLQNIERQKGQLDVDYEAQSYYQIDKIWSISQLFFPSLRRLHPENLRVSYIYPHWLCHLGQDFTIYCLVCPIDEKSTRAYLVHFTSLKAFKRLHRLPVWFRKWIKDRLFGSAQKLLDGLVGQDVLMIEQEQQAYEKGQHLSAYEFNPAISQVQAMIKQQSTHAQQINTAKNDEI